ncbi:MAG TPA: hypothetical protein PKY19_02190 [Oscillospiraceae bacterium]|nr:hypothetical protein [Oscillospiraceae bacterium]
MAVLFNFAYLVAWILIGAPFLAAVGFLAAYFIGRDRDDEGRGRKLIAGCVFAGIFLLLLMLYRALGIYLLPF